MQKDTEPASEWRDLLAENVRVLMERENHASNKAVVKAGKAVGLKITNGSIGRVLARQGATLDVLTPIAQLYGVGLFQLIAPKLGTDLSDPAQNLARAFDALPQETPDQVAFKRKAYSMARDLFTPLGAATTTHESPAESTAETLARHPQ